MTDVHSQCLCSCNLSPHSVKAVCWKSRVSLYTQDFTMLLFSCVLTSCCRLSFHIKFYSYLFLLFDLIEFQLSRKRCGIGLSCNYIETRKLNVNNFFFAYSNFFSFFFFFLSPMPHSLPQALGKILGLWGNMEVCSFPVLTSWTDVPCWFDLSASRILSVTSLASFLL